MGTPASTMLMADQVDEVLKAVASGGPMVASMVHDDHHAEAS